MVGAPEAEQDRREQSEDAGDAEPDAQASRLAARGALRQLDRRLRLPQQAAAVFRQQAPGFGETHVAVAPEQQRTADPPFELADPLAQRRLRHVQPFSRASEVQGVGERDDRVEIGQFEHRRCPQASMTSSRAWCGRP